MRSYPSLPLASLLMLAAVAAAAFGLGGCFVTVADDEDESEPVELAAAPEETASCDVSACDTFCSMGGDCNYEAADAANCVTDCLDACDDGFADDGDAAVMSCMQENLGDAWCDNGLLDRCCAELDGWSDFCDL